MDDPAVVPEYEGRGLDVRPAVMHPSVAADRARCRLRIQTVEHRKLQPEPLDRPPRFLFAIRRERHDPSIERVELRLVLLEVSQLLTAMASPVAAVEEKDGGARVQLIRYAERAAGHSGCSKLGESVPHAKCFHDRTS
jgi:hypothetical protein